MKREFKSGTMYLGDNREIMKSLENESVDLVVTSPPYDNLRTYNDSLEWSFDVFKTVAKELARLIKQGGVIVWNVNDASIDNSETGSSFRQALYFKDELGLNLYDTMIWFREHFPLSHRRYEQSFEYMFILSKGIPNIFNGIRDKPNIMAGKKLHGSTRNKKGEMIPKHGIKLGKKYSDYGLRNNVWNMTSERNNETGHPAIFPVQIPQDHIMTWTNEGDIVLDPFMGSGTTAIAAINTDRKWIGIEKEQEYYDKACERIRCHALNQSVVKFG